MKPDAEVVDEIKDLLGDSKAVADPGQVTEPTPPPIDLIKEGSTKIEHPKDEEPVTPKGYGELKVGMEGKLNGVPVVIRKITKKDIILRPLNRSIRDKAGLMVSFKEGK